jgi:hypothetical protein
MLLVYSIYLFINNKKYKLDNSTITFALNIHFSIAFTCDTCKRHIPRCPYINNWNLDWYIAYCEALVSFQFINMSVFWILAKSIFKDTIWHCDALGFAIFNKILKRSITWLILHIPPVLLIYNSPYLCLPSMPKMSIETLRSINKCFISTR